MFFIFDIDGVLADPTHRLPLIEKTPQDWASFFKACDQDTPIWAPLFLACDLAKKHRVELWTGRPERTRVITENWLRHHQARQLSGCVLRMRADGDHRADTLVKREFLEAIRRTGCEPDLIFEDRARVVRMYRDEGLRVAHVAEGEF